MDHRRADGARRSTWLGLACAVACVLAFSGCNYLPFRRDPPRPGRTKLNAAVVTLPAKIVGNFLIVETKWDRHGPYRFIIDTGAANTLVTPALVRRHGTGVPGPNAPRVRVRSAEGDVMELATGSLHQLELGSATFEDVPVLVHDLAELSAHLGVRIDGLLGFPLFRETRLTLDYPRQRVLLQAPGKPDAPPGTAVAFDDSHKTPVIPVRLGNRNMIVLLDSGSDATMTLNPHGLDAAFVFGPRPGATVGTIAGDHPQEIGRLGEDLAIAGHPIPRPIVDLTEELSAIGGGLLKYFSVTFDPAHDRVSFRRDAPGPIVLPPRRSAGISFSKTPAYWRVAGVIRQSAAADAGIQFGDLVTRINGEPVSKWSLARYEQLVASAESITFSFLFGSNEVDKPVATFNLVP